MAVTIQIIGQFCFEIEDIDCEVIDHSSELNSAVEFSLKQQPDIILLASDIQNNQSLNVISSLYSVCPDSKIILFGNAIDEKQLMAAVLSGVYGYLEVSDFSKFLIHSIKAVCSGEAWFTRRFVGKLIDNIR